MAPTKPPGSKPGESACLSRTRLPGWPSLASPGLSYNLYIYYIKILSYHRGEGLARLRASSPLRASPRPRTPELTALSSAGGRGSVPHGAASRRSP